jgi:hypothetical protein
MRADDPPTRGRHPRSSLEDVLDFLRHVIARPERTRRLALLMAIPLISCVAAVLSAVAVVVALVGVRASPIWLLGALPSAVMTGALVKIFRVVRGRRRGRISGT